MRPLIYMPPVLFAIVAFALFIGLTLKPSEIPSALIGAPAPDFALPAVDGTGPGLSNADLAGHVSIVNVFASWCLPCRSEHPLWMEIAEQGTVVLHGINYKDTGANATQWLEILGNPYESIGADLDGRVGVDWGVYGVPETFVVDAEGRIQLKFIGPVDRYSLENEILPKVRELQALRVAAGGSDL